MRIGYLSVALPSLASIVLSIVLLTSSRWIIDYRKDDSQTNYGLFVYETCQPSYPDRFCYFVFYSPRRSGHLYPYYKAGAVGGAFMITGVTLYFMFMVFMFIKASTGLAGRCLSRVFNHYYVLYYIGFVAVFLQALGWGLYSRLVPHTYKFRWPFYVYLVNWIVLAGLVIAVFTRKILQGNAKRGGWLSLT